MSTLPPFAAPTYALPRCLLRPIGDSAEAHALGRLLAPMDPWHRLGYASTTLAGYLLRQDDSFYRYAIVRDDTVIGVVGVRFPWLRGVYLELIGLAAAWQGAGLGHDILDWLETQARCQAQNVWVLVSGFNTRARAFYVRHGYVEIGPLTDFIQPGADEIFLRKHLR